METYLRVAAAADHPAPLGHVDAAGVLDQKVVGSADVGVRVTGHWAIHVVKDGVLVSIQVVFFKPLARATEERPQTHLREATCEETC